MFLSEEYKLFTEIFVTQLHAEMQSLPKKIRCRRLQGLQGLHGGSRSETNQKDKEKVHITSGKLQAQKLKNNSSVDLQVFFSFQMHSMHTLMHFGIGKTALLVTVGYGSTG